MRRRFGTRPGAQKKVEMLLTARSSAGPAVAAQPCSTRQLGFLCEATIPSTSACASICTVQDSILLQKPRKWHNYAPKPLRVSTTLFCRPALPDNFHGPCLREAEPPPFCFLCLVVFTATVLRNRSASARLRFAHVNKRQSESCRGPILIYKIAASATEGWPGVN